MKRSFRAYLAEQDQEFTFVVKSIYNLHDADVMDMVRLALLPYDLRELTKGTFTPPDKDQKTFPNVPNAPVYTLKAKLGLEPAWEDATEKVSLFTHIRDFEHLLVHPENMDPQKEMDNSDTKDETKKDYKSLGKHAINWDATPDEVDDEMKQHVGLTHIGHLMKELEKERKEREDLIPKVDPNIKEAFITTHIALKEVMGPRPKGFYLIERPVQDPNILRVIGPFKKQPVNYEFVGDLANPRVVGYKKLSEKTIYAMSNGRDFTYIVENASHSAITEDRYSVEVQDMDSGHLYNVVVNALDDAGAREAAVNEVAKKYDVDKNRLLAADPEVAG